MNAKKEAGKLNIVPKTARYRHCGIVTETIEGEETVFCHGCHAWLKVEDTERVNANGTKFQESTR